MDSFGVATWNLRWTSRRSRHYDAARARLAELTADILVLTETTLDMVPADGHVAEGGKDWGYQHFAGRRKVLLWSRWPIADAANDVIDPAGRHVSATIETPIGRVRAHAVCVPWSQAHVTSGRRDRKAWEDHLSFLDGLREVLRTEAAGPSTRDLPVVVAGDINQREGPKPYGTRAARTAWAAARAEADLAVVTDEQIIDQIALGPSLIASDTSAFPPDGMSDHHAVRCHVAPA